MREKVIRKTTTLYAALERINSVEKKIITVEDPVEYRVGGVIQLQVKPDIGLTFARGLRHIVRQDPDIILVGEIRDRETAEIAIHAALTGHLVFSTLHTLDAPESINRIVSVFAPHHQRQVRLQLGNILKAVVSQRLVPRMDGPGRVPAVIEVMISTPYIQECIQDKEKTGLVRDAIAAGVSQYGMQTFDQSIFQLYRDGYISFEQGLRYSTNPDNFKLRVMALPR